MSLKPPFQYYGGKTLIADKIAALLPRHDHYLEPFAGSLAVLLAKPRSTAETVNDLNQDLMTFWRVLRDRPADLEEACSLTPHSRAEFAAAREPADDELEQARRVWVRLSQSRSGTLTTTGWRYRLGDTTSFTLTDYLEHYTGRIVPAAARLAGVSLECRPALELIRSYGKYRETLIYADPPYVGSVRNSRSYVLEMDDEPAHIELSEALHAAQASVVLSGYDGPLYDKLYGDWHRAEISTWTGNGTGDKRRKEVLWSNRPFAIETLF